MKLSIVVPCYNEAKNIPLLLKRFSEVILRDDIEVVMVDNGSTDNSAEVLESLLHDYTFARSVHVKANRGYGYGIIQGLRTCSGDFIGWTHADMQTDPADLLKALEIIEKNHDNVKIFVKGKRKGRPLSDQFFTNGMSIFETFYLKKRLLDVNAQPNIFSQEFFGTWQNPPMDFALDLYALYMAGKAGLNLKRFDVIFPKRVHGKSHWNNGLLSKWKFIKRTITFSRKLKKEGIR